MIQKNLLLLVILFCSYSGFALLYASYSSSDTLFYKNESLSKKPGAPVKEPRFLFYGGAGYLNMKQESLVSQYTTYISIKRSLFEEDLNLIGSTAMYKTNFRLMDGACNFFCTADLKMTGSFHLVLNYRFLKPADIVTELAGNGSHGEKLVENIRFEQKASILSLGIGYTKANQTSAGYYFNMDAGYGFLTASETEHYLYLNPTFAISNEYSIKAPIKADALMISLNTGIIIPLYRQLRLRAGIRYQFLNFLPLIIDSDIDTDNDGDIDVKRGDPYKDLNHEKMPLDYSGLALEAALQFGF